MHIREVIVVEGRDDTVAVHRAVRADTIETGGSALNESVYRQIEHAMETRGVIIFTDPDAAGERIRKLVARRVPGCKHAFLSVEDALKKGRVGVEYASPDLIRQALAHVWSEAVEQVEAYTIADLLAAHLINGPRAYERRLQLGTHLRIGYANGKQLLKRLNMFRIPRARFEAAVQQLEDRTDA